MKRDFITRVLSFIAGAGIGSALTYKIVKTEYEKLIQDEVDSVKKAFSKREETTADEDKTVKEEKPEEQDKKIAYDIIEQCDYVTESDEKEDEEENEEDYIVEITEPYVISPEEFGDSDYATITLWYYTDGVVTNDNGKVIKNTDELIGREYVKHFGEYEEDPDAVYVRNEDQEIDYEVLKEYRAFSDMYE